MMHMGYSIRYPPSHFARRTFPSWDKATTLEDATFTERTVRPLCVCRLSRSLEEERGRAHRAAKEDTISRLKGAQGDKTLLFTPRVVSSGGRGNRLTALAQDCTDHRQGFA